MFINEPSTTTQLCTMSLIFTLTFAVRTAKSAGTLPAGKSVRGFPGDIWKCIIEYIPPDLDLDSLSRVSQRMYSVCKEKTMEQKSIYDQRVAAEAQVQLVNKLERFYGIARVSDHYLNGSYNRYYISKMDASAEIEHYLNGFDSRMYGWMRIFYFISEGAVKGNLFKAQIKDFAITLAQHRATYSRTPPHRRINEQDLYVDVDVFDAYIKMRDNNMEILQEKQLSLMMFDRYYSGQIISELRAVERMMQIMEAIGVVIQYPGVQEMNKDGRDVQVDWKIIRTTRHVLSDTADTTDIADYWESECGAVAQDLSQDSCIGVDSTDKILKNLWEFIRLYRYRTLKLK